MNKITELELMVTELKNYYLQNEKSLINNFWFNSALCRSKRIELTKDEFNSIKGIVKRLCS